MDRGENMALTSGFYDSRNYDRKYNAEQFSEIFDNIITDGIFSSQGEHFAVTTANNGMQILVGSGRAWFEHTWNKNDSTMVLNVAESDATRQRRDIVVLEINHEDNIRKNSIKIVQGTPTASGALPPLVNTTKIKQYPLAYITVPAGATTISASNIENRVGISPTPFVTGVLQSTPIDSLWAQWKGQFEDWFEGIKLILTDDVVDNLTKQLAGKVNISDKATAAEATAGTNNTHWMTPALVKAAIDPLRNTVYIQNLNRRVYVNAMLSDIAEGAYTISLPSTISSNSYSYHAFIITSSYVYGIFSVTTSQGTSSIAVKDTTAYSYRASRPFTSTKSFSSISNTLVYSSARSSYDSSAYGVPLVNVTGSNAFDICLTDIHKYDPSTSATQYWRVVCDLTNGKIFGLDSLSGVTNYTCYYAFATTNYKGVIYLFWGNSSTAYEYLTLRYRANSGSGSYTEKTQILQRHNDPDYRFRYSIGGYGDTLYYVRVTHPNTTDTTFEAHSVTISSSGISIENSISNVNIKNATRFSLLFYDSSNAYIMVGGYSIPLIFSFVNKRFTNAEVVAASSTSSMLLATADNSIQYLGVHDNLHYFRNPATGTVFTLAYSPSTTTAFVIRSNITLASFTGATYYRKPYNNEWRPQHFVVYGKTPSILDWQGHSFSPEMSQLYNYLMPNAISTDTVFGFPNPNGYTITPVGPDAEFTLVTDGKAAT